MKITDFTTIVCYGVITMMVWFLAQTVFSLESPLDFALNESIAAQQNRTYYLTPSKRRNRQIEKTKENRKNIRSVVSEIDREKLLNDTQQSKSNPRLSDEEIERLRDQIRQNENSTNNSSLYDLSTQLPMNRNLTSDNDSTTPSQQSKSNPRLSDEEIERLRNQIRHNENSTNNSSLYDLSTRNLTSDNTTQDKANASTTPTIPTSNVTTSPHPEYRLWWYWIGIGIGIIFVILCAFVLFCCFHQSTGGSRENVGQPNLVCYRRVSTSDVSY